MKFKDKEEALRRLEAELLQEEEEEEIPDGEYEEEYDEEYEADEADYDEEAEEEPWEEEEPASQLPHWMAGRVNAYNTDALEADLDEYSRKVYKSRSRGRWVAAVALILLAVLLLVLAFFVARNGGF